MRRTIEVAAPWMNAAEAESTIDNINRTPLSQRKVKAIDLGERLGVTNAERELLRLWTIRPIDMAPEQLEAQRRAKKRKRMQRLRRKAGVRSRTIFLATARSKQKPWAAAGVSRATWYRRLATTETGRETGPCQPKLSIGSYTPVSLHFAEKSERKSEAI